MMSPRLVRVDRVQVADAFAVLGILTVGDVDDVLDDDRRRDHFVARLRPDGVLRIGVELPEFLAGLRLVAAHPPVALAVDHLHARRRSCRRQASTTGRAGSCRRATRPPTRACLSSRSTAMMRRRLRRRDVDVALVLAVARRDVEHVVVRDRRRVGEVVRKRADFLHHVERPEHVGVVLAGQLLVLERARRSRCRGSPGCRRPARRRGSTRNTRRRRSTSGDDAMPWNGQSLARPDESFSNVACHMNSPVASRNAISTPRSPGCFGSRSASLFVPTSTTPLRDHGIAVALRSQRSDPFDVLAGLDVPRRRQPRRVGHHVPIGRAAPHRPDVTPCCADGDALREQR